jgi:hypothetical protein
MNYWFKGKEAAQMSESGLPGLTRMADLRIPLISLQPRSADLNYGEQLNVQN